MCLTVKEKLKISRMKSEIFIGKGKESMYSTSSDEIYVNLLVYDLRNAEKFETEEILYLKPVDVQRYIKDHHHHHHHHCNIIKENVIVL